MKNYGVPLVDKPADMIGKVDGMLIEAVDGTVHWERAKPFLEAGIPCFIDKPYACSLDDAKKMAELAAKKKLPIFSSSSLRYAPEVVEYVADAKHGKIVGVRQSTARRRCRRSRTGTRACSTTASTRSKCCTR